MLSDELFDLFRSDVVDIAAPYLWSDSEVWLYMNDAYRMFVRRIGGVPDTTSDITNVDVVSGEATAEVSPLILKFRKATLASTGRILDIINYTDMPMRGAVDYGGVRRLYDNRTPGPVQAMIIGEDRNMDRGIVQWVQIPDANDAVALSVLRLPLTIIDAAGQKFTDIGEEHHEHLLLWMKHRAYGKQDAETFDRGKRDGYKADFEAYCATAMAEAERYKSKVRQVAYGGI